MNLILTNYGLKYVTERFKDDDLSNFIDIGAGQEVKKEDSACSTYVIRDQFCL